MNQQLITRSDRQSLTEFLPHNIRDLAWLANEVVKSGMFKVGNERMNGNQAFVIMMKGAELGLTPMQSLAEISIIKGRPFVSKDVITARITRSPRCQKWDPYETTKKRCAIRFKVADSGDQEREIVTTIEDIPQRYFKALPSGEPSNWTLVPEDMLYAWTVRRVARRFFPEALLDIGGDTDHVDETKIIDIAAVERETGNDTGAYGQHSDDGGTWILQAAGQGGAFLRCDKCGETMSPPQEVRDAIRGRTAELAIAATQPVVEIEGEGTKEAPWQRPADAEPIGPAPPLEPGEVERELTPEEQTAYEHHSAVEAELAAQADAEARAVAESAPSAEIGGGADSEVQPAPVSSYTDAWRANARAALAHHLQTAAQVATAEQKAVVIALLKEAGWNKSDTRDVMLEKFADQQLAKLIEQFHLPQPSMKPMEVLA